MRTDFVLDALEQAIYARRRGALTGLVHHSDAGSQYLSMRYTDRLVDAGIAPSVGSHGDAYDNALAESVIGLYKTEVIRRKGPVAHPRGRGVRHLDVGALVQHATTVGASRGHSARRVRSAVPMPRPRWPDSTNSVSDVSGTIQSWTPSLRDGEPDEYYDLVGDPDERRNVIDDPEYTDRVAKMRDGWTWSRGDLNLRCRICWGGIDSGEVVD